jgi:hypothetical protein
VSLFRATKDKRPPATSCETVKDACEEDIGSSSTELKELPPDEDEASEDREP